MEKLRRNITITFAGYSNMTCAWVRRIAPSQGVKSNSTDRLLTWANQKVSARWSIYWDGLVRVTLHPRLRYDCCSTTTVNQERHAMAVGDEQQRAFDKLKDSLTKNHVMLYLNPRLNTEVIIDASPVGHGGLLVQDGKVINYASRTLGDVDADNPRPRDKCRE